MDYLTNALTYAKNNVDTIVNDIQSDLDTLRIYPDHDDDIYFAIIIYYNNGKFKHLVNYKGNLLDDQPNSLIVPIYYGQKKHMLSPQLKDVLNKHIEKNLKTLQAITKTTIDTYKKHLPLKEFLNANKEDSNRFKERFLATTPNKDDLVNAFLDDLLTKPVAHFLDHYGIDRLNALTTKTYDQ